MGRIIQYLTDEELEKHYQHLLEDEVLQYGGPKTRKLWEKILSETKAEIDIRVAEYCDNDVISTEAVWNATKADFTARQILADIAGMDVNKKKETFMGE